MLASFGSPLVVSRKPSRFATVSEDGLLSLFDTEAGALLQQHTRPPHLAVRWTCMAWWQAAVSSSGKPAPAALGQLALGSDSGVIAVWDLAVGQISHELRGHTQAIHDLQYEQNGKTLLSCSRDKQVCCWNASSGELLHTFSAGQAPIQRLAPPNSRN